MEIEYKSYSVKELIEVLTNLAGQLPEKEETKVTLSDFEGNYTYRFLQPNIDEKEITLAYELHEKGANNIQKLIDLGKLKVK